MYTYVAVFSFLHPGRCTYVYMIRARLYCHMCTPLLPHVRSSTSTSMYVHVRDQNDNATYASTRWVPTVRHFLVCEDVASGSQQSGGESFFGPDALPCVRRCSWWVRAVKGEAFFREIWLPIRWVPAVRWRNNYFAFNKEALPCGRRGPNCQPLHAKYSSDGSRSLTILTTPRREHQGDGRRRGLGRGRRGAREDMAVDAHAERSTRVHWFAVV